MLTRKRLVDRHLNKMYSIQEIIISFNVVLENLYKLSEDDLNKMAFDIEVELRERGITNEETPSEDLE